MMNHTHIYIALSLSFSTPTHRFHCHLLPLNNRFYDARRRCPLKCHLLPATDCHNRNVEPERRTVDYRMALLHIDG